MKSMKKAISILLALVMCLSLLPMSAFAEEGGYATQADLDAAYAAALDVLEASVETGDTQAAIAAMDAYLAVYDRLSPEDQTANAEAYQYVASYRETLVNENHDDDIDPAAYDPTRTIYLYINRDGGSVARVTPKKSEVNGKTLAWVVQNYFSSYYKSTNTYKHRSNSYGSWSNATYVEDTSYQDILIDNWHEHSYSWVSISDKQHQQQCSCGQTNGNPQSHSKSVQSTTPATCNAFSSTTYYCSTCGHTWTEYGSSYATHTWQAWQDYDANQHIRWCSYNVHNEYKPHTYGAPVINGNQKIETCTDCGHKKTTTIEQTANYTVEWWKDVNGTRTPLRAVELEHRQRAPGRQRHQADAGVHLCAQPRCRRQLY